MSENKLPDYGKLLEVFVAEKIAIAPAELHGYLCASICVKGQSGEQGVLQPVLERLSEEGDIGKVYQTILAKLLMIIVQELTDEEFQFYLLLPDDKEPITIRINALANWCAGFLSGLGQFGFASKQVKSAEITEFLDDLLQISQVKDKGKPGTEGDEKDYTELVEYVRIGVLMLYTHCT